MGPIAPIHYFKILKITYNYARFLLHFEFIVVTGWCGFLHIHLDSILGKPSNLTLVFKILTQKKKKKKTQPIENYLMPKVACTICSD